MRMNGIVCVLFCGVGCGGGRDAAGLPPSATRTFCLVEKGRVLLFSLALADHPSVYPHAPLEAENPSNTHFSIALPTALILPCPSSTLINNLKVSYLPLRRRHVRRRLPLRSLYRQRGRKTPSTRSRARPVPAPASPALTLHPPPGDRSGRGRRAPETADMARTLLPIHLLSLFALALHALIAPAAAQATASPKRGLIAITEVSASDERLFAASASDLTWYYNYKSTPTSALQNTDLAWFPMLFSATDGNPGTGFANGISAQIAKGANITTVLGFNEPDNCDGNTGGSCMPADLAASVWVNEIEPLRAQHGVKLVSPAVTSAETGFQWMQNWYTACAPLGGCHPDYIGVHYYGGFEGLASHVGRVNATYLNVSGIYLTEWAYPNASLEATQSFYNMSVHFLDQLSYVKKYSYFGAFRSSKSNVGPNAAFLNGAGQLTDIGSWYLGGSATGRIPGTSPAARLALPHGTGVAAVATMLVFFTYLYL